MSTHEHLADWVDLEGCFNFRDLGSYRTRSGRQMRNGLIFRSDGLQHLSERDLLKLREEVGLRLIIDLRSPLEVEEIGCGPIAGQAEIVAVPLFNQTRADANQHTNFKIPDNMGDLYFIMLQFAGGPIAEVIRLLAEADSPAVFHCAAGKDRTGVISAILLSLLGVPRETIVADYAFSRKNIDRINERLDSSDTYKNMMHTMPEDAYDADPAAMESFLDRVDRELDGVEAWAAGRGIDRSIRDRLEEKLLE